MILASACVFCRTPLTESDAPTALLDYLQDRLPRDGVKRAGLGRGRVRTYSALLAGQRFEARVRAGRLRLTPDLPPARWLDALLKALSESAKTDAALRATLSRAGWALR